jgi:glutathione S-transferase
MKGLWPASGKQRAEALSWTTWSTTELMPFMLQYIYHGLDAPMSFHPSDRAIAIALGFGITQGIPLNQRPGVREWLDRCSARPVRARVE